LLAELVCQTAQGVGVRVGDDCAEHRHAFHLLDLLQLLAEFCLGALDAQVFELLVQFLDFVFEQFRLLTQFEGTGLEECRGLIEQVQTFSSPGVGSFSGHRFDPADAGSHA